MTTRLRTAVPTLGLLALTACGAGEGDPDPVETAPTSTTSERQDRPADPTAAPTDDTSEPTGPARPEVTGTIATGLAVPWGIDFLPGGDAIVTERDSERVLRIAAGDHRVTEVGTVSEAAPSGEGGLLGVAVSPSYAEDRTLYFYVTTASDNRVVRARLDGGQLGESEPVLTGIPRATYHDGGRIAFGPDGHLYVATGDAGDRPLAQDPASLAGKILRITADGDPAPGNPEGTHVWSLGHRNVQGLAWVGDQLWASEFGWDTWDELNRITAGGNYGWPEVEGRGGEDAGYVDPLAQWPTDDASPSGLAAAEGSLWMAALNGERLWRIDPGTGENRDYLNGEYGRLRSVVPAPDGTLWLTTSNRDGRGDPVGADDRILQVSLTRE